MALRQWHAWKRSDGRPIQAVRLANAVVGELSEPDRRIVDAWLTGATDKDLDRRFGVSAPYLELLRRDLIADIAQQLALAKSARRRRPRRAAGCGDYLDDEPQDL